MGPSWSTCAVLSFDRGRRLDRARTFRHDDKRERGVYHVQSQFILADQILRKTVV